MDQDDLKVWLIELKYVIILGVFDTESFLVGLTIDITHHEDNSVLSEEAGTVNVLTISALQYNYCIQINLLQLSTQHNNTTTMIMIQIWKSDIVGNGEEDLVPDTTTNHYLAPLYLVK